MSTFEPDRRLKNDKKRSKRIKKRKFVDMLSITDQPKVIKLVEKHL